MSANQHVELNAKIFPLYIDALKRECGQFSPVHEMPVEHLQGILVAMNRAGLLHDRFPNFPETAVCRWCGKTIKRWAPGSHGERWTHEDSRGLLVSAECYPRHLEAEPA